MSATRTKDKPASVKREATVEVAAYPPGTLFLRENVAEGTHDGVPVEVDVTVNRGAMLVRFTDDGVWYAFTPAALIRAAWEVRQRAYEETSGKREVREGAGCICCGPMNPAGKCLVCGSLPPGAPNV